MYGTLPCNPGALLVVLGLGAAHSVELGPRGHQAPAKPHGIPATQRRRRVDVFRQRVRENETAREGEAIPGANHT